MSVDRAQIEHLRSFVATPRCMSYETIRSLDDILDNLEAASSEVAALRAQLAERCVVGPDEVVVKREECERIARELNENPVNRMANAEHAMFPPHGFDVSEYAAIHHPGMLHGLPKICKRGPGAWAAFVDDSSCIGKDGQLYYEPSPSNRTPEFITLTRFATPHEAAEALRSGEDGKDAT